MMTDKDNAKAKAEATAAFRVQSLFIFALFVIAWLPDLLMRRWWALIPLAAVAGAIAYRWNRVEP